MVMNNDKFSPVSVENINGTTEPTTVTYNELERLLMSGSLVLIMLATLIGNGTVCLAVSRHRKLRTRANIFIINLSCADIGVAIICMPFSLYTCLKHEWVLSDVLCKLNGFLNIVFCMSSLLTLTAISVETYFAICKPLYHRHMSRKSSIGLLLWTWIQPVVIACIPLFGTMEYEFKSGTTQCGVQFPTNPSEQVFAIFVILFGFVVPLGIMGFTYSNIFRSARRHTRRVSRVSFSSTSSTGSTAAHKQVAVTVLILLVVFLFCWLPYFLYAALVSVKNSALSSDRRVLALGKAAYWCAFTSSALNPYIYGFRNPQFRKEFQFLLCLFCPCIRTGLRTRGCSTTTGSRGSWEGYAGFEYNHVKRTSLSCPSPKARLSVDFAQFPPNGAAKFEMLALKSKLSNCSSDPGYRSQEDNRGFDEETGPSEEDGAVGDSNNNNSSFGDESQNNFIRTLGDEASVQNSSYGPEVPILCAYSNQVRILERNAEEFTENLFHDHENEVETSRSETHTESPDNTQPGREMLTNYISAEELLTPTRLRGWSLRTLGARLKLGWVESTL